MDAEIDRDAASRYSRQLLMPEIGRDGQLALMRSSVLIIGAGGLGSPSALYLAASGIGKIGLVDYDTVELSNLHRQIIHRQASIGVLKAESARKSLNELNPRCHVETFNCQLDSRNAMEIISQFDIVLDASDNPPTRYLINDACVILGKPLVSACAVRMEGQLTVYNYDGGPCYRCLYPVPPPKNAVSNCDDGGVVGCVVGILGSIQAMEAIKLAIQLRVEKKRNFEIMSGKMLLYNGFLASFKTVRLRSRKADCAVCGNVPTISTLLSSYEKFCGMSACDKSPSESLLTARDRISCQEYSQISAPHLLLDVRPQLQFEICALSNAVNIPIDAFEAQVETVRELAGEKEIYVICRRGNKSQHAVRTLQKFHIKSRDIIGGLTKWAQDVDTDFPMY